MRQIWIAAAAAVGAGLAVATTEAPADAAGAKPFISFRSERGNYKSGAAGQDAAFAVYTDVTGQLVMTGVHLKLRVNRKNPLMSRTTADQVGFVVIQPGLLDATLPLDIPNVSFNEFGGTTIGTTSSDTFAYNGTTTLRITKIKIHPTKPAKSTIAGTFTGTATTGAGDDPANLNLTKGKFLCKFSVAAQ